MRARVEGLLEAAVAAVSIESVRARTRMPEPYDMAPKESITQVAAPARFLPVLPLCIHDASPALALCIPLLPLLLA